MTVRNIRAGDGVREVSVWNASLAVEIKAFVEAVEYDQDEEPLMAPVRPTSRMRGCGGLVDAAFGNHRGPGGNGRTRTSRACRRAVSGPHGWR